jgi:hypothetical protein
MATGAVGKSIGIAANRLGKDTQSEYENIFGSFSLPQQKLQQATQLGGLKDGSFVEGRGQKVQKKKYTKIC